MTPLLIVALLFTTAAEADPVCADVQRLAAGAEEAAPFASLRAEGYVPRLLRACHRTDKGYYCGQNLLPPEIAHDTLGTRIAACLPGADLSIEERKFGPRQTRVRKGRLLIELHESGSERAHVGRMLSIFVRTGE